MATTRKTDTYVTINGVEHVDVDFIVLLHKPEEVVRIDHGQVLRPATRIGGVHYERDVLTRIVGVD